MIDFDRFVEWAESRFDDVVVKDNEVKLNSIFCEDYKHHLWCNPNGGKHDRPYGVFRCWKTDTIGSLVNLVKLVDNCSFQEALEILDTGNTSLKELEQKVQNIFEKPKQEVFIELEKVVLKLPAHCYLFDDLPSINYHRSNAVKYLAGRKIRNDGLYVCTAGEYRNRIVIPYYNPQGTLIYFNSRYIGGSEKALRYMGPPKELGIGKGDVLFVPTWPPAGSKIYLTEGEFDALSLREAGFYAAACGGKNLTDAQIEIIRSYTPVLSLDADKSGDMALREMGDKLLRKGFKELYYVRPPKEFKDWNAMLQQFSPKSLALYIKGIEKVYDHFTSTQLKAN